MHCHASVWLFATAHPAAAWQRQGLPVARYHVFTCTGNSAPLTCSSVNNCISPAAQVTPAAVRRLEHGHQQHCTTLCTVSQMIRGGAARSESCTCWSRCVITVRPVGAGRRTTRGGSTRRTTPVSDTLIRCDFQQSDKSHDQTSDITMSSVKNINIQYIVNSLYIVYTHSMV